MKFARFLTAALLLAASGAARAADEQQDNLRGLSGGDLCPPLSYVYVDDEENTSLALKFDEALDRYATLYGVPYGDPKTCTAEQSLVVDTFRAGEKYIYNIKFVLELRRTASVVLPERPGMIPATPGAAPERRLNVSNLQVWHSQSFGLIEKKNVAGVSLEQLRGAYEDFALDWKASHKK